MDEKADKLVCRWEFDNWNGCSDEKKTNKVELFDTWMGQKIVVTEDNKIGMEIHADRDQWGTFITFSVIGPSGSQAITIAQEDGTKSFIDALIGALERFKGICNLDTEAPNVTEFPERCGICGGTEGVHDPNCHLGRDPNYYDKFTESKGSTDAGTSGTDSNSAAQS